MATNSTSGHESEAINVEGLKAALKASGNKGIYNYATCSTAAGTAAKVIDTAPTSFKLTSGAVIIVKFTNAISVANATLKVGSSGTAKPIYLNGTALTSGKVAAGTLLLMRYNGTQYDIVGGVGGSDSGGTAYTPTLSSAPTSSTTTYTKDGVTYNFAIGQFCRVADASSQSGYTFYQLQDLNNGSAVWVAFVVKLNPSYTPPVARALTYNKGSQALMTAGSSNDGTVLYSNDGEDWGTSVPTATNAGTYTRYWRLAGDLSHNDVEPTAMSITIAKANPTYTAPTKRFLSYTGSAQALLNAGSVASGEGTMQYSADGSTWGTTIPTGTTSGNYTVYWRIVGNDNYNGVNATSISVTIAKASRTITVPDAPESIGVQETVTITPTVSAGSGDGGITVSSSNTSVVSVSGYTLTGNSEGTATITVSVAEGVNYQSSTTTFGVEVSAGTVDLGLPSGRKWAVGNIISNGNGGYKVGAETDYGAYVSWGNTVPHFSSNGSTFDDDYSFSESAYNSSPGKYISADFSADSGYDAARQLLGGSWRLPTKEDMQELYDNTDSEWATIGGVNGKKFMKKTDHSVYVFFPAAGAGSSTAVRLIGVFGSYWSSSWNSSIRAYHMYFDKNFLSPQYHNYRQIGFSVRAVK